MLSILPSYWARCICCSSWSSSVISFISSIAARRSISSSPRKLYCLPWGLRKSSSLDSFARPLSSSGSPNFPCIMSCSCCCWSGFMELNRDCVAAICCRICSSSSSRLDGGVSPNMSPYLSMNSSKPGSSPAIFLTSMSFRSLTIFFMRLMSPSDISLTMFSTSLKKD